MAGQEPKVYKLRVSKRPELVPPNPATTSSLNPARPPEILTPEIFDLICTQMKFIVGLSHKLLIQKTMKAAVDAAKTALPPRAVDFGEILWRNAPRATTYEGSVVTVEVPTLLEGERERGRRGRSPGRGARALPAETRKYSMSLPKNSRTTVAGGIASRTAAAAAAAAATASSPGAALTDLGTTSNDSDQEGTAKPPVSGSERRGRSSSTGPRLSTLTPGASGSAKNLKRLTLQTTAGGSGGGGDDSSVEEDIPPAAVLNGVALDATAAKQIAVLQSLPPEVQVRIVQTKGPVYGQWMVSHPLVVRAAAHVEAIRTVQESSIIAAKKLEWELDILREWDEKRMETFERFLVSRRSRIPEPVEVRRPAAGGGGGGAGRRGRVEYYKDKGRQASNR